MGKELDSQRQPKQPYVEAIVNLMSLGTEINMKFYLWPKFMRYIISSIGASYRFFSNTDMSLAFNRNSIIPLQLLITLQEL